MKSLNFDLDCADASTRWMDAGMPPPNIIVRRRSNGHAHYIYQLGNWVRTDGSRGGREIRYANAIDAAMTHALGADTSYSGRFTHNPLCPTDEYETIVVRDEPYSLAELATYADLNAPRNRNTSSGLGRNVAVFERLADWCPRNVLRFASSRRDWDAAVAAKSEQIATAVRAEMPNPNHPYTRGEVRATAKSVADYIWRHHVEGVPRAVAEARLLVKAHRARIRAEKFRRQANAKTRAEYLAPAAERQAEAARLRQDGMTLKAIAFRLKCSISEVARVLKSLTPAPVAGSVPPQNLDFMGAAVEVEELPPSSSPVVSRRTELVVSRHVDTGSLGAARSFDPCDYMPSSLSRLFVALSKWRVILANRSP